MKKSFLIAGAITAMLAVALGAFGAHALREFLEANQRADTFETAVKYQFYHAFALIITGILYKDFPGKQLNIAGKAFLTGIFIFPGSLYLLIATGATFMGAITPFGGVAFIVGWLFLVLGIVKK